MKKICLLASVALAITTSAKAQVQVGVMAGANANNQIDHYTGQTTNNQLKVGFHAGGLVDFGISRNFSIQDGLMYIMKGGQQEREFVNAGITSQIKDKLTLSYIEMPLTFVYKLPVGSGRFMIGAGGYAAVCVNANDKYKYQATMDGSEVSAMTMEGGKDLTIGNDAGEQIKRLDFGATGLLGYQMNNGIFVKASADLGLYNIVNGNSTYGFAGTQPVTTVNDPTSKNQSYMLTVGYMIGH
jgi:hypothetical protein